MSAANCAERDGALSEQDRARTSSCFPGLGFVCEELSSGLAGTPLEFERRKPLVSAWPCDRPHIASFLVETFVVSLQLRSKAGH